VIAYEWSDEIPARHREELAAMLARAAAYDAEAGFSTVDGSGDVGADIGHLLVTMPPKGQRGSAELDALPEAGVVAYLRLDRSTDGECGQAQFVVREEFRSLGVGTLLLERLRDEPGGWASRPGLRSVHAWAHGSHPAAERMSWRFEARQRHELAKTMHLLGGRHRFDIAEPAGSVVEEIPVAEPGHGHRSGAARADAALLDAGGVLIGREGGGEIAVRIEARTALLQIDAEGLTAEAVDDLLVLGLHEAQRREARLAVLYVDVDQQLLLHISRELGFFHDQSDRDYLLAL